jgi:hypothetical protein
MDEIVGKKRVPLIPAPNELGYCNTCYFWRGPEQEAYFMPDGNVLFKAMWQKTGNVGPPPGGSLVRVRTCCLLPIWKATADTAWCASHKPGL